jgi:hypothetical protein
MGDWTMPLPLSRPPPPRSVRMSGVWLSLVILIVVVFSIPVAVLTATAFGVAHEIKALEKRGIDVAGTVVDLHAAIEGHGRSNHGPLVDYTYEPKEYAGKPDHTIHTERVASQAEYPGLRIGGAVAVVYDPLNPERSELKSRVEGYSVGKDSAVVPPALLLMFVIPAVITAVVLWNYFGEKRLLRWGKATRATIIGEVEYQGRRGKMARVMYTFEDDQGATLQGEKAGLATQDDERPDFVEHRLRFLRNPTAVYDPRNSARNMLYPGDAAILR